MMTAIIALAVFLNFGNALIDWYRISNNKKINHTLNAVVYTVLCGLCAHFIANIWYIIPMILLRPVVFDVALNLLRGKHPFHVSTTTTSVVDRLEIKVINAIGRLVKKPNLGMNGLLQWLIWFVLFWVSVIILNLVK